MADIIDNLEEAAEEIWRRHHPGHHHGGHVEHHEIAVKAFELWEQMITAGGVDYGSEFYWFTAEWEMGIISTEPLPPPVE